MELQKQRNERRIRIKRERYEKGFRGKIKREGQGRKLVVKNFVYIFLMLIIIIYKFRMFKKIKMIFLDLGLLNFIKILFDYLF